MNKSIKYIRKASSPHMVGDGFKVKPYISRDMWKDVSPFLMLDYVEPWVLLPTKHPRGVEVHPHKGFETVSILWEGALEHEDSSGSKGKLFAGDVQWMTAGSGILHKEFHEEQFSKKGGILHSAQLWVNLPAQYKNVAPAYQHIQAGEIPEIALHDGKAKVRVLAGELNGTKAKTQTYTRITIFDVDTQADADFVLTVPETDNTSILVLKGTIHINNNQIAKAGDILVFETTGQTISIQTNNETHLLLLSGAPIHEPLAAYGPFVMNTQQEILDAIADYNAGKMGVLS